MEKYCKCGVSDILDIAPCPPPNLTYNEFRNYALSQNINDDYIKIIASNCQISDSSTPPPWTTPEVVYKEEDSYILIIVIAIVITVVVFAAVVVFFLLIPCMSFFLSRRISSTSFGGGVEINRPVVVYPVTAVPYRPYCFVQFLICEHKRDASVVARKRPNIVPACLFIYDCCKRNENEISSERSMTDINQKTQNGHCKSISTGADNQIIGTDKTQQDIPTPRKGEAARDNLIVGKDETKDEKPIHAKDKVESPILNVPENSKDLLKSKCKKHASEVIQSDDSSEDMKSEPKTVATKF